MARSGGGIRHLLLIAAVAAAAWFVYNRIQGPESQRGRHQRQAERRHEQRGQFGRREFGRRDQFPQEHAPAACDTLGVGCATQYFAQWADPGNGQCHARIRNGFPEPDPRCTPGGVNPTVTADVLRDPRWRTSCVRNCLTSEAEKHVAYGWYGIHKPKENSGENQVCELDHLVPLELGGTDGMGNLWPECGPDAVTLHQRYFKIKDRVENYLADEVKAGRIPLQSAQEGIASNWTQYLGAANRYCAAGGRC